jgi:hypothetical protein
VQEIAAVWIYPRVKIVLDLPWTWLAAEVSVEICQLISGWVAETTCYLKEREHLMLPERALFREILLHVIS